MTKNQNKKLAEKAFWNSWSNFKSDGANKADQYKVKLRLVEPIRRDDKEYAARLAQQHAEERRKENLKLMAMLGVSAVAVYLVVFLLGLIVKPEASSAASHAKSQQSAGESKEDTPEMIEASIQEEIAKGGFSSKEAYFSSELVKQSADVGDGLSEFSKKIMLVTPKMNVTSLVIAGKLDQITNDKTFNGFGIEVVGSIDGESDNVSLISHLKGMTSPVEFYAEGGRVVAHFKDYPESYCAGTKGTAVCGS
jgi:hypothetical protein